MVELRPARILQTGCGLRRGMARAHRLFAFLTRPRGAPPIRQRRAPSGLGSPLGRGRSLACLAAGLTGLFLGTAQAQVFSSCIWPPRDYTRLTLESITEANYQMSPVMDPASLVLDLETGMTPALAAI